MKKQNLMFFLLVVLIGLLFVSYHQQNQLKDQYKSSYNAVVEELHRLEEVNSELTSDLTVSKTRIGEQEDDINKFKTVLEVFNDGEIRKVLFNLLDIRAFVEVDGQEIRLPRQGELFITEDHFTFYARVQPLDLSDLDFRLTADSVGLNPLFTTIYFPSTENSILSKNELKLEYTNLDIGDRIQFKTTQIFREAFGVVSETITITRVEPDHHSKGKDYFVTNPLIVTFVSDGVETEIHDYFDVQDDMIYASIEYLNSSVLDTINTIYTTLYIRDNAVGYMHKPNELIEVSTPLDSIILPSLIIQGSEIEKGVNNYAVITNEQVVIEVEGRVYDCVELSNYYKNELRQVDYYAKGIGLVLSINDDYEKYGRISPRRSE